MLKRLLPLVLVSMLLFSEVAEALNVGSTLDWAGRRQDGYGDIDHLTDGDLSSYGRWSAWAAPTSSGWWSEFVIRDVDSTTVPSIDFYVKSVKSEYATAPGVTFTVYSRTGEALGTSLMPVGTTGVHTISGPFTNPGYVRMYVPYGFTVELYEMVAATRPMGATIPNQQRVALWVYPHDQAVEITWLKPRDTQQVTGYAVYWSGDYGHTWSRTSVGATTFSHTVTGLTNGHTYMFKVIPMGPTSDAESGNPPTIRYAVPMQSGALLGAEPSKSSRAENMKAATDGNLATAATLLGPDGYLEYTIMGDITIRGVKFHMPEPGGATMLVILYDGAGVEVSRVGTFDRPHYIVFPNSLTGVKRIRFQLSYGASLLIHEVDVLTSDPADVTPPSAPSNVRLTEFGPYHRTIAWDPIADPDLDTYLLQTRIIGQSWGTSAEPLGTVTTHTRAEYFYPQGISPYYGYEYRILARDKAGNVSAVSNTVTYWPGEDMTLPPLPTEVTASNGEGQATLTWVAQMSSSLQGFRVYRSTDAGVTWTSVGSVGKTTNTYTVTGLADGVSYHFAVTALGPNGYESAKAVVGPVVLTSPIPITISLPDGSVWDPSQPIGGTAPSGATITIRFIKECTGESWMVTLPVNDDGNWSYTPPDLPDCTYSVTPSVGTVTGPTVQFIVDTTPPVVTPSVPEMPPTGWYTGPVTVILDVSDGTIGTGVSGIEYSTDGGATWHTSPPSGIPVTQDGTTTIWHRATDSAGNTSAPGSVTIGIDTTAPVLSPSFDSSTGTLSPGASDGTSGVGPIECSVNGGPWVDCSNGLPLPGDGIYTIIIRCRDNAGNPAEDVITIIVDRTPPTAEYSGIPNECESSVSPLITVTDATSGISQVTITLDGQPYESGTPVTVPGEHVVQVIAVDNADNTTTISIPFTVCDVTQLTLIAEPGQYSDPTVMRAVLTGYNGSKPGETITFAVDGEIVGSATTGADGMATLSYPIPLPEGSYPVLATFSGNPSRFMLPAEASAALLVEPENASLSFTGGASLLAAQVTQADDGYHGDLSLTQVQFQVTRLNPDGTATELPAYVVPVQGDGTASTPANLPEGFYRIAVSLIGNGYFIAPPVTDSEIVVSDGKGFTIGGASWGSGKDQLTFEVRPGQDPRKSAVTGTLNLRTTGLELKMTQFDWLVVTPTAAQFEGRSGEYTVRVGLVTGQGKKPGRITITVWQDGVVVYSVIDQPVTGSLQTHQAGH